MGGFPHLFFPFISVLLLKILINNNVEQQFMIQEISFPKPKVHLFVCINDRGPNSPKPSCGPRMTSEDVSDIKQWIRNEGLTSTVYCTKAQCLGFCNAERDR